ncbi:MAG: hypothetical protein M0R80_08430 [Proteobacteria bacterium]|jgi:hypothetical protein|nr:hypothetical protein [Pseudomonadota bacterium]
MNTRSPGFYRIKINGQWRVGEYRPDLGVGGSDWLVAGFGWIGEMEIDEIEEIERGEI